MRVAAVISLALLQMLYLTSGRPGQQAPQLRRPAAGAGAAATASVNEPTVALVKEAVTPVKEAAFPVNGPNGDITFVCEAFSAEQCPSQKHCTLCTRVDGLKLCFTPKIAEELSRYVFTCKPSASLEEGPAGADVATTGADVAGAAVAIGAGAAVATAAGAEVASGEAGADVAASEAGADVAASEAPVQLAPVEIEGPSKGGQAAAAARLDVRALGSGLALPRDESTGKPCLKMTPQECKVHATQCALCSAPLLPEKCYSPEAAAELPAVVFHCQFPEASTTEQ